MSRHTRTNNSIHSSSISSDSTFQQINLDWLISYRLGGFGRYQRKIYILLGLTSAIIGMNGYSWIFLAANAKHRCRLDAEMDTEANYNVLPEGKTFENSFPLEVDGSWSQCKKYDESSSVGLRGEVTCDGKYVFDRSQYETTANEDFDLICDNKIWYAVVESMFKIGILFGSLIFGNLSDFVGRLPVFVFALIQQTVFGFILAFSESFVLLAVCRFFIGMANSGVFLLAFVLATELVGKQYRMSASMGIQYFYTLGCAICGICAYEIREWRSLQLALTLPGICFFSYYWILPESIRWLLARGKKNEAVRLLRIAAEYNHVEIRNSHYDRLKSEETSEERPEEHLNTKLTDVFKYKRVVTISLNVFLCWFVNSGVYNGLAMNSVHLGGNEYLNFLLVVFVEVPAYIFVMITLNRLGRKFVLSTCMMTAGVMLIVCGFLPKDAHWTMVAFSMAGKLFNAGAYAVIYLYSTELFPTVLRSSLMGVASVMARFGGILSDYVIFAGGYWYPLPHLVFGAFSLTSGAFASLLPETLGKPLPETLEDGEKLGRQEKDD